MGLVVNHEFMRINTISPTFKKSFNYHLQGVLFLNILTKARRLLECKSKKKINNSFNPFNSSLRRSHMYR